MRVLNICNLKGGVGKTITSVNLAYVIAHVHKMRVLVIDNDKQGNTSKFFSVHSYDHPSVADLMTSEKTAEEVIRHTSIAGIDCIPANMKLLEANKIVMMDTMRPQQKRLENALRPIMTRYDICIIDNAPDENMSVINALTVGDDVIIPVKVDKFTFDGVDEMLHCIELVRSNFNPLVTFRGCVLTSYRKNEVNEQGAVTIRDVEEVKARETPKQERTTRPTAETPSIAQPPTEESETANYPRENVEAQEQDADFPYAAQSPEAYAIMAVYGELKALRESYQGAAQRAIAVADNTQGAANFTAAAEYVETLMEIVAQEMADIEAGEGVT